MYAVPLFFSVATSILCILHILFPAECSDYYVAYLLLYNIGHSDLTNRFTTVCNTAVDWVVYGVEKYTSEHAQYLQNRELSLPLSISLEVDISKVAMDVAFLRHLLNFFYKALQPALRKVWIQLTLHRP